MTTIITSGKKFIDIDAYACMYAYKELMTLQGKSSLAYTTATINASVTERYRKLDTFLASSKEFENADEKTFIVMDVSDPDFFDDCVDIDHVSNVIDHHPGFVEYWQERLGDNSIIEPIGAAATLVYREFVASGHKENMSRQSAELLAVAIISNTLNFGARITKQEDYVAYDDLLTMFEHDEHFAKNYFLNVQRSIDKDTSQALIDDSKNVTIHNRSFHIAQLEVWDGATFLDEKSNVVRTHISNTTANYSFLNLIEIGNNYNTIIFRDETSMKYLQTLFPDWKYDTSRFQAITPNVILRKEILTKLYDKTS